VTYEALGLVKGVRQTFFGSEVRNRWGGGDGLEKGEEGGEGRGDGWLMDSSKALQNRQASPLVVWR
jgi:hypothetical protein